MKTITRTLLMLVALMLCGCSSDNNEVMAQTRQEKIQLTIGGATHQVTLVDNAATQALVARLQQAPVTVTLNSSGGFEIWGALGFSLPTSDEQTNAQAGDVILYNGSNICIFYGSNTWSYTRLGRIDNLSGNELKTFLKAGESNISVTLSLGGTTGVSGIKTGRCPQAAYSLGGTLAQARRKGIVVGSGRKVMK